MKGRKPTAEEERHIKAVAELGCIVCLMHLGVYSPCEIHHIEGKTKPNAHFKIIGLCYGHHRGGVDNEQCTSRHPFKKRFELRYGTEEELHAATLELLSCS
jgi:hypothetical protein